MKALIMQTLIFVIIGMAIEAAVDGIASNGRPRSAMGSIVKVGLYVSWATVIFALSLYW